MEDRKLVEQVQQLLAVPPAEDGQLPRLSTVSPSRYGSEGPARTDTYVRRNADDELDHALRNKPVVLVADSRAGKSRTAAEAARRLTLKGICPGCGLALPIGSALQPVLVVDQGRPSDEGGRVRRLRSCARQIGCRAAAGAGRTRAG